MTLGARLEALPGEAASEEVHQHVAQRLHVIAAGLFDAQVGFDTGVARGAGELLVFPIRDVHVGARVPALLRQAEIDKVHHVAALAQAHQEVVRLDALMDEVVTVQIRGTQGDLVSQTVFSLKRPPQNLKRSSRPGPKSCITMMLKSPSVPNHFTVGMPTGRSTRSIQPEGDGRFWPQSLTGGALR